MKTTKLITFLVLIAICAFSSAWAEDFTLNAKVYSGGIDVPCEPLDINEIAERPMISLETIPSESSSETDEEHFSASAAMNSFLETSSRL